MDIWASPVRIFHNSGDARDFLFASAIRKFHGIHVEKLPRRIHYGFTSDLTI